MLLAFLSNPKSLENLFDEEPNLKQVPLRGLILHEDGPSMLLRFDVAEFPKHPPRKWILSKANTVQLTLEVFDFIDLKVAHWGCENVVDMNFSKNGDHIDVDIKGHRGVTISCKAKYLYIKKISAYQDEK